MDNPPASLINSAPTPKSEPKKSNVVVKPYAKKLSYGSLALEGRNILLCVLLKAFEAIPACFGEVFRTGLERYSNIASYLSTMVFSGNEPFPASWVKFPNTSLNIIATQGPQDSHAELFWQLVYEKRVSVIVMIIENTQSYWSPFLKCGVYFPYHENTQTYGSFEVSLDSIQNGSPFNTRMFTVRKIDSTEKPLKVLHVHYHAWVDHCAPKVPDVQSCIDVVLEKARRDSFNPLTNPKEDFLHPILVHCSAGVGRTGTFILALIFFLLFSDDKEGDDFCYETLLQAIEDLRKQRMSCVMTGTQLEFLLDFLEKLVRKNLVKAETPEFEMPLSLSHSAPTALSKSGLQSSTGSNSSETKSATEFVTTTVSTTTTTGTTVQVNCPVLSLNRDEPSELIRVPEGVGRR